MSQTLYRKYRSQRFAELIGQEMAVRVLRNSLQRGRISHAYLMCGPRGTGKTSVARIFAKALNCPAALEGDCCGVCEVCTSIAAGAAVDVVEMDAASNRGIEDVKELRARVQFAPLQSKYKVYIIDEVHQISRDGFNALLKTLEEPPAHIVFCLCTTDPGKLPVTILSRCIRLDFQRLPHDALAAHLQHIASAEGMVLEADAALRLAGLGEGSARDAISLLDQLTVYCDSRITLADVSALFQLGDPEVARRAADAIATGDPASLQGLAEELAAQGWEYQRFLLELAAEVRLRLVQSGDQRWRPVVEALWAGLNLLKEEAFPALLVQLVLAEAQVSYLGSAVPATSPPGRAGERGASSAPAATSRVAASPPLAHGAADCRPNSADVPAATTSRTAPLQNQAAVESGAGLGQLIPAAQWEDFWRAVHRVQMTLASHILRGVAARLEGQVLELLFAPEYESDFRTVSQARNIAFLGAAARSVFGEGAAVRVRLLGDAGGADPAGAGGRPVGRADAVQRSVADVQADGAGFVEAVEGKRSAGSVDSGRLEESLERIERQLGSPSLAISEGAEEPVGADTFMELFEAETIEEETQ